MSRHLLLLASVLCLAAGLWILNAACAFAMFSMPPPEEVAEYRAAFYQRALVGIACIIAGVVLHRVRNRKPSGSDKSGTR